MNIKEPMGLRWIALAALFLSACCCGDPESDPETFDIRDGDLALLDISANAWVPFALGGLILDHNYILDVVCPVSADSLDDRGDSGTVAFGEFFRGPGTLTFWFVGRNTCREAGALLAAARADLAGYEIADTTGDFTRLRYRLRGQELDSILVPVDVIRDSTTYPRLSALVSELFEAIDH